MRQARFGGAVAIGQPALDQRGRHLFQGLVRHGGDAGAPAFGRADARGGVAQDQLADQFGAGKRQPEAGGAAHRQAAEVRALDVQVRQQFRHVVAKLFEGVLALGDRGLAVAAGVVAQDAEVFAQFGDLAGPHVGAGAQRIGEHEHRRVGGAIDDVVQPCLAEFGIRHVGFLG
ncbi:hypothetical protein D3C85_1235110 [compost metagenome]